MQFKPKLTSWKTWRLCMAILMAGYGLLLFSEHNRHDCFWALTVSLALFLGLWSNWPGRLAQPKTIETDPSSKLQLT